MTKIGGLSQNLNITPFQFFLSALQVLLYRFTGMTNQCIGIIDANRSESTSTHTVGYLINMLPVRFALDNTLHFSDIAEYTRIKICQAMANAGVPFRKILEKLKIQRASIHSPLVQILVNYRLGALEQDKLGDCNLSQMQGDNPKTPFDITLVIVEKAKGECLLQLDVQEYLYSEGDSLQMLRSYESLLKSLSQTPKLRISEYGVFSSAMREESLRLCPEDRVSSQTDGHLTVSKAIETQMRSTPHAIAIKDSSGSKIP